MKKTFENFGFKLFAVVLLLIAFSCDKDSESEPLIIQEKFSAPNIENAKQFFNKNSGFLNTGLIQAKSSSSTLLTDWESSKTRDYKETPEADVDILYTPIYLETDKNAKAFLASTQQGNNIESKIVITLYKETSSQNSLSAYIFIFNLDGTLELKYNIENNQPIPFATNTANRQTSNRTTSFDCTSPILSLGDFIEYIQKCTIQLDEVVVIGGGGGESGGEEGNFFDADLPNFLQIPYIGDIDSEVGGRPASGAVNGSVYASNIISPTSYSISAALELPSVSTEGEWLQQQSIENPSLLEAIAEYLNLSKKRLNDPTFDIVSPNQLPDVSDEVIEQILALIAFGMGSLNIEGDVLTGAVSELATYTSSNYPGINDGLPFEWWNDDTFVSNNINLNIDAAPNEDLTTAEKWLVAAFPAQALAIRANKEPAETETSNRFGTNGINDKSDAFRHAFFNAMNSNDAGDTVARLFSSAHESEVPANLILEAQMDLHNNDVGHTIGDDASTFVSDQDLSNSVYQALLNGELVYLFPINYSDPNFWDDPTTSAPNDGDHGITTSTQIIPTDQ